MLSTAQVASELGVTVRRVQALINAGRLAAFKVGRDWVIDPKAIASVRERPPGRPRQKKRKNSTESH